MSYTKYTKRQDSFWKQLPCRSGETSINLSKEICDFLTFGLVSNGEETEIAFKIYKSDFYDALDFIKTTCPLYRSSSQGSKVVYSDDPIFQKLHDSIENFFGDNDIAFYIVTLYNRNDKRIYLKGLKQKGFNIRDFLVENCSALVFSEGDKMTDLRVLSSVYEGL